MSEFHVENLPPTLAECWAEIERLEKMLCSLSKEQDRHVVMIELGLSSDRQRYQVLVCDPVVKPSHALKVAESIGKMLLEVQRVIAEQKGQSEIPLEEGEKQ